MPNSTPPPGTQGAPQELSFAYPFRKKDGKEFTDEHEFHALLARESSGFFPVSIGGMWHGGIHISAGGAGAALDLDHGVRGIARGEVVAYRADRSYPVSEVPAHADKPAVSAPYSTGFALVRHTMEYPAGNKLTFFSLYMHLQGLAEYQQQPALPRPPYWSRAYMVTGHATDRPKGHAHATQAPADQVGLNVRTVPKDGPVLGILACGSRVLISEMQGQWGRIAELEAGARFHPIQAGGYVDPRAVKGWIYLGKERGQPVVEQVLSESRFDQVVVLPKPFPVNAGDLIGHLGPYELVGRASTGNRMVHIEVLCDAQVGPYIAQSRDYLDREVLAADYTILRIDQHVKLYRAMDNEGADAPQTGVIQVYPVAALAAGPKEDQAQESVVGRDGVKRRWWKIDSADARHAPITGWVREGCFPGGKVTIESPHQWVDFEIHEGAHDPLHTMFVTPKAYLDYWLDANEPAVPALAKLNPLATQIYRAIIKTGNGARAADDLRHAWRDRWYQLRLSRLIVKHESEWANPGKWRELYDWIEQRTEHDPGHNEELRRIAKLVWWDQVAGNVAGFPSSPDVFHIHPLGLVGNFFKMMDALFLSDQGLWFIFRREAQAGVSNHLHWPGGASGVTLGPGYDMKARLAADVAADMRSIGLTEDAVSKISLAAGKVGIDASAFAAGNRAVANLNNDQEMGLLRHVVQHYEQLVRNRLKVSQRQNEFDALVSFAYNPGGQLNKVINLINEHKVDEAMHAIESVVTSGGVQMRGLVERRNLEVRLYKDGEYK